jgi:hypothetical protein
MNTVTVKRLSDNGMQTLGALTFVAKNSSIFVCKTLELPWKNNTPKISCIPQGQYECKYTFSNHMNKFTYEILSVPERSGIRIHSANLYTQLLGCIALGSALKDLNLDGQQDVIHSGETILKFEEAMKHEPFILTIS